MIERPILFSAPMVRALLNGSKTQTRRMVKPVGADHLFQLRGTTASAGADEPTGEWAWCGSPHVVNEYIHCPYGKPGNLLWVRETWSTHACFDHLPPSKCPKSIHYWSDGEIQTGKCRPSIHMPRWASRITLEVTGIRVERLQDISVADAIAEGCPGGDNGDRYAAVEQYRALWDSINAANRPKLPSNPNSKRYARVKQWLDTHPDTTSWDSNPWVWVVEFKRLEAV